MQHFGLRCSEGRESRVVGIGAQYFGRGSHQPQVNIGKRVGPGSIAFQAS